MTSLIFVLNRKIGEWNLISHRALFNDQVCDTMGFLYRANSLPFSTTFSLPIVIGRQFDCSWFDYTVIHHRPSRKNSVSFVPFYVCINGSRNFAFPRENIEDHRETMIDMCPIIRSSKNYGFSKLLTKLQASYRWAKSDPIIAVSKKNYRLNRSERNPDEGRGTSRNLA